MHDAEILIVSLLVAVAGLSALALRLSVPYPIVLVIGGTVFGFVPGMPEFELNPDLVLLIFLPPLLYSAAFFANIRELRADLRAISLVSVGLVLITMVVVAAVAHELIDGLTWPAAFALGAIVSPTDPLAGALIMRRLGVPRRQVAIIEGEGLFNDATALVAFRVAVAAVVTGTFSLVDATAEFVLSAVGGIAIGLVAGFVIAEVRRRTRDIQVSVTISLLSGYAAFVPADIIGASGVLAVVTCGLFMGIRGPRVIDARTRLQGYAMWETLDFVLNALLFVLIGLQLPIVLDQLDGFSTGELVLYGIAISVAVTGTRIIWSFTAPYLIRALDRRPQQRARRSGWRPRFVIAWSGMRGSVSLAAALALPLETDAGEPFPQRDLIIFLTFAVIFTTLVIQGLSLPAVIRKLEIGDDGSAEREELAARLSSLDAALMRLDELDTRGDIRPDTAERMRGLYRYRRGRFASRTGEEQDVDFDYEERALAYQQAVISVLEAQRQELLRLRDVGEISNDVMNRVLRELDLEEARLEIYMDRADPSLLAGTPEGAEALRELAAVAAEVAASAAAGELPRTPLSPAELEAAVASIDPCPEDGVGGAAALRELGEALVAHGVRVADPRTAAHLHTPPLAVAAAAELVIGATNQSMDSFDQAPAATYAEDRLVRWLGEQAGLPDTRSGVLTAGGTASNVFGLLLARDRAARAAGSDPRSDPLPDAARSWRILASDGAHFSVRRAAALMGIGGDAAVPVATDASGSMSVDALDAALAAADPGAVIAIVATAGTTDLGAIDPIDAIAERAAAAGAWLHVDAAVGAGLLVSDAQRPRLRGIERADSITMDMHKLLWQPIGASALLVRDEESFAAVREPSDYLDREDDDMLNLVGRSLDTSRRFDAFKVLVSLRALGRRRLGAMVDHLIELTEHAGAVIEADPDLELVAPPQTVTVVFRRRDGRDAAVQRELLASGQAVIGRTRIGGVEALKLTLLNPAATAADVDALIDVIARQASST